MPSARTVLAGLAGTTAVSGFVADWNRTHLRNPAWPPHARFHDAMTMTLAGLLGGFGIAAARRAGRPGRDASHVRRDLHEAALLPGLFWTAQAVAGAYPDTGGLGSEFPELVPHVGSVPIDERVFSIALLALTVAVHARARRAVPRR